VKLLRTHKVRADTTVVPANVDYPTDSGLLAKAVTKIARTVRRIQGAGGATRTRFRDRRRSAGRRVRAIASKLRLRGDESRAATRRLTGQLAELAAKTMADAAVVLRNARRRLRHRGDAVGGRLRRAVDDLAELVERTATVVAQTRTRLGGGTPHGATRLVSLHDPHARPIRKGRLGKPVEFGYKAQVVDNPDGIVLDHTVEIGAPPDAPQLTPAIARVTARTGKPPRAVTADRGYGQTVEDDLHTLGVTRVVIPRKAKPSAARRELEHRRPFRRLVKWRTGSEGRISTLKRGYGWNRSQLDGIHGARIWCGHGIFAHNLVKISALTT
jgi:transposase, IS5 family